MKNVLKNTIRKKINLSRKKLIEQPLKILKKINIKKLTKFTSSSLAEKYKNFKERAKQKELHRIKLLKEEKIKELKNEKLEQEKQKNEEIRLIKQNELNLIKEEKQKIEKQEKLKVKIIKQQQQIERKKIKLEAQRIKAEEQKLIDEEEEKTRQDDLKLKEEKLRLEFFEKQRIRQEQQKAKIENDKIMALERQNAREAKQKIKDEEERLNNIEIDKQKKDAQRLNEEEHKLNYQKQKLEEIEQNIKKIEVERLREKEIKILNEADELREKEKQLRLKEQLEIEELKELRLNDLNQKKIEEELQIKEEEIRPKKIFDEYLKLTSIDTVTFFKNVNKEEVNCPACNKKGKFWANKQGFTYQECSDCLSIYVNPRPPLSAFNNYYRDSPSTKFWATTFYKETENSRREKLWKPKAQMIKDRILKYQKNNPVNFIIDIGGGYGVFDQEISKIMEIGTIVIEPSVHLAEICRNKDLIVIEKFMENILPHDIPTARKCYVSFELFEHLHNPKAFLETVYNNMNSEDFFIFTTLSGMGIDIQLLGPNSNALSPPHHLNFFFFFFFKQKTAYEMLP